MKVPNRTCTVIVFGLGVIFLGVHSLWPQSVSEPSTSSPSGGQLNRVVEAPFYATMWDEHVFPDGTRYRINLSTATFLFDVEPWSNKELKLANKLAVNYRDAINAAKGSGYQWITSVDVVCGITKHQEDAVMAAIERAIASAARSYVIALEKELQKHVASGTKPLRSLSGLAQFSSEVGCSAMQMLEVTSLGANPQQHPAAGLGAPPHRSAGKVPSLNSTSRCFSPPQPGPATPPADAAASSCTPGTPKPIPH